ncbi:hypothetical protein [Fructobacillus ficulneus]|uniref:hypothetical protein n=1 Tax=Fructobacillus ficulneus TaxID=157463 RepID=UPI0007802E23|nr:hypothetical protein [Fructobacillus ficulneus]
MQKIKTVIFWVTIITMFTLYLVQFFTTDSHHGVLIFDHFPIWLNFITNFSPTVILIWSYPYRTKNHN